MSFVVFENDSAIQGGGAGIQAAQFLASQGVDAVITGNCGPNAVQTLSAAGIELFAGQAGTVREVVDRFKKGNLSPTSEATVGNHFGMSDGAGVVQALIKRRLQLENLEPKEALKNAQPVPFIVSKSKPIIQVLKTIQQISSSDNQTTYFSSSSSRANILSSPKGDSRSDNFLISSICFLLCSNFLFSLASYAS